MAKKRLHIAPQPKRPAPAIQVASMVRAVKPYQAVSSLDEIASRPGQVPLKLDWNESTVPPSPRVLEAIQSFLSNTHHLNWYPVLNSANLAEKLADFYDVSSDQILVTNGSDDALNTVCATYLEPGDTVLVASPTYQHFLVFAQSRGADIVHHYGPDPFVSDVDGLIDQVVSLRPRILYIVNPNNPTGADYTTDQVERLLAASPGTLVIVDEAYSEFANNTCIELLHTYSNLVVTRTFSKAYGMAGLRVGYAFADARTITDLHRVFNPKSVNVLAQVGAMAAIEDQAYLKWYVDEVNASKQVMRDWCAARDLDFVTTPANFVMIKFDRAPWVARMLGKEGVYVRDRSHMQQLNGFVRFSVGTVEQTCEVLDRLTRVLSRLDQNSTLD